MIHGQLGRLAGLRVPERLELFRQRVLASLLDQRLQRWLPAVRGPVTLVSLGWLAIYWWQLVSDIYGRDAHAYWSTDLTRLYAGARVGADDAFLYSPAFAQLIAPLTELSWPTFYGLWAGLEMAALVYLVGPIGAGALTALHLSPLHRELWTGNIHLLLAAVIVIGFRSPGVWAFAVLTKLSPGVGVIWFAIRREWRQLFIASVVTGALVVASFAVAPRLWVEWAAVLQTNAGVGSWHSPPIWSRLPVAVALLGWGAMRGHRWTVVVASFLALPVLWDVSWTMLLGVVPLLRRRGERT